MTGPLGPERLDHLFAMLAAVIANVNRPKGRAPAKIEDFLPQWDADAPQQMDPMMMRHRLWSLNNRNKTR